jgi:hypothetical protein
LPTCRHSHAFTNNLLSQDRFEADYWDEYESITAEWNKILSEKKAFQWIPNPALTPATIETPDGTRASKLNLNYEDAPPPPEPHRKEKPESQNGAPPTESKGMQEAAAEAGE